MDNRKAILEYMKQIEVQEKTGSLYLVHGAADHTELTEMKEVIRVYFHGGLVSAMSSSLPEYRLGQYCLKEGIIDPPDLHKQIKGRDHRPLGEAIVAAGLAEPVEIQQLLQKQAIDVFRRALENGFRIESFEPMSVHLGIPLKARLDVLLLDLARTAANTFEPGLYEKIGLIAEHTFATLPWQPAELAVLDCLLQPKNLEELMGETGLPESQLVACLQTLRALGMIEIREEETEEERSVALTVRERLPLEQLVPEAADALLSQQLETVTNEHSFASEQFASLKVRIKESRAGSPHKVITVTSPHIQDGKSLVSANLAFSFARDSGTRTILVDCDLRRPSLHRYLGIPPEPGLIGYLSTNLLRPYCFMRQVQGLFVLAAGGISDSPIELLSLRKMRELFDYLRIEFDVVIIDSPPLNPISDTRLISGFSDDVILVIRRGRTPFATIEQGLKVVDRKKILGVVFNDLDEKESQFSYYQHSYYHPGKDRQSSRTRRRKRNAP